MYILQDNKNEIIPVFNSNKVTESVKELPDVPLLRSASFTQNIELRKRAIEFIKNIPLEGPLNKNNISEVHYDAKNGFWITLMDGGIQIHLGEDRIPIKVDRVAKVLMYLKDHEFEAESLDANYLKKVLVRRK